MKKKVLVFVLTFSIMSITCRSGIKYQNRYGNDLNLVLYGVNKNKILDSLAYGVSYELNEVILFSMNSKKIDDFLYNYSSYIIVDKNKNIFWTSKDMNRGNGIGFLDICTSKRLSDSEFYDLLMTP